jgi:dihydroflavonol-4-reductase
MPQIISRMMTEKMPAALRVDFCVVNVRNVVDLHIRAMTAPEAAGERFIAAGDWVWMADVSGVLRSALGADAENVPTRRLPDIVHRIVALFNRQVQFFTPSLGRKHAFSSCRVRKPPITQYLGDSHAQCLRAHPDSGRADR